MVYLFATIKYTGFPIKSHCCPGNFKNIHFLDYITISPFILSVFALRLAQDKLRSA